MITKKVTNYHIIKHQDVKFIVFLKSKLVFFILPSSVDQWSVRRTNRENNRKENGLKQYKVNRTDKKYWMRSETDPVSTV